MKPIAMSTNHPFISKSIEETKDFALNVLKNLLPNKKGATVLCLYGDLGSGKTAFTKELGALLGLRREEITSPTFVIEKIYKLDTSSKSNFTHLIHIDASRIEDSKEMLTLGWEEIVNDTNNLIIVEWPEKIKNILPEKTEEIYFTFVDEVTRAIKYTV